ncbi:MAG: biopolymer transporter ExbD [Candidatus Krumholzibacteria bacterium]|nr:biopolymer transporter ExbD [Candidatus Krumholzibacteria bacterium]MDH4335748.1 biopolymer transporter ExbD [Candidatus Krumholzibacteria bacterium]MDH5269274.1 biopolymer transporter ExbD [Candidatus Krumholzibacteria bacterium]
MNRPFIEHTSTVAKINVTPIIDVALVLVIILMVTAPMIALSDMEIRLPPAETRSMASSQRVTLTIGRTGEIAIDDTKVGYGQVASFLDKKLRNKEDNLLVVRADEGVPYATVQALISEAKSAGAKRIAIATTQRGSQR